MTTPFHLYTIVAYLTSVTFMYIKVIFNWKLLALVTLSIYLDLFMIAIYTYV